MILTKFWWGASTRVTRFRSSCFAFHVTLRLSLRLIHDLNLTCGDPIPSISQDYMRSIKINTQLFVCWECALREPLSVVNHRARGALRLRAALGKLGLRLLGSVLGEGV